MKQKTVQFKNVPKVVKFAVQGYIRINMDDVYIPESIIDIIILFYDYFNFKSNIIEDINIKYELMQSILKQLNKKFIQLERIYCGSEHGMDHGSFHKYCDNKAPTLLLFQTIDDAIFGGYTTVPHIIYNDNVMDYRHLPDRDAFLFSLEPNIEIFPFKKGNKKYAIYQQDSRHIIGFGDCGHDLWVHCYNDKICFTSNPDNYLDTTICLETEIREMETFKLK